MLIFKGKVLSSHLKQARITEDELMEAIREHGSASVSEVDLAVLKTSRRRKAHKVISKQQ